MLLPLLKLGSQEQFQEYQKEFNRLYFPERVIDILGNRVVFERPSCWHVCFKPSEDNQYGHSGRNIWSQERAERIGWIFHALSNPSTEIRPNATNLKRQNHLLIVDKEIQDGGGQEYFIVVTEKLAVGFVLFVTAFPANHRYWSDCRKAGKRLYPKS